MERIMILLPSSVWSSPTLFQDGVGSPAQNDVGLSSQNDAQGNPRNSVKSNAQIHVNSNARNHVERNVQNDVNSTAQKDVKSNGQKNVKISAQNDVNCDSQTDVNTDCQSHVNNNTPIDVKNDVQALELGLSCIAGVYVHENDEISLLKLPSIDTVTCFLCKCREKRDSACTELVHLHLCLHGLDSHRTLRNTIIMTFVECGRSNDAEQIFYRYTEGNSNFRCSLLELYLSLREYEHVFKQVSEMEQDYGQMDRNVLQSLLKACAYHGRFHQGQSIHSHIVREGMDEDNFIASNVVEMYAKCGALSEAWDVFNEMPIRDVVALTILSSAYSDHGLYQDALYCLEQIPMEDVTLNVGMLLCGLKACKKTRSVEKGKILHIKIAKWGGESNTFIGCALLGMYAECGLLAEAQYVSDGILSRDVVSWTALIAGYADHGRITSALECLEKMRSEGLLPNSVTFLCILRGCTNIATIEKGQELHMEVVKEDLEKDPVIGSALVDMYAKCGLLAEAQAVFEELQNRDVVLWTTLIAGYAEQGHDEAVLKCLEKVQAEGVPVDSIIFVHSLKACGNIGAIRRGQKIHAEVVKEGFELNSFVGSTLMDMYIKSGLILEAVEIFHELPEHDVISWTTLISGYIQYGLHHKVQESLEDMQREGIFPSDVTLACSLQACGSLGLVDEGRDVHIQIIKRGFEGDTFVANSLLDLYAKCARTLEVWKVFDDMTVKDIVSWNTLITCLAEQELNNEVLISLKEMQLEGFYPNDITVLCCLKACGSLGAIEIGQETHTFVTKLGLEKYPFVGNTLVDMYAKCGYLAEAMELFNQMPFRDVISWNILLLYFVDHKLYEEGLHCLQEMEEDNVTADVGTFVYGLECCGSLSSLYEGHILHAKIVYHGFEADELLGSALIDMYSKCCTLLEAKNVFDRLRNRGTAWSHLISGYTDNGFASEALSCYELMQTEGISPDATTVASLVKGCSLTGTIDRGKEMHILAVKIGCGDDPYLCKMLIDMYAKCVSLIDAHDLLWRLERRDLFLWSAVIAGHARQGETGTVFRLIEQMRADGLDPDGVTSLSILSACNHGGLVDVGQRCFEVMIEAEYCNRISLDIEHHNCMIDLLGRAGQLGRALSWLGTMPFPPNYVTWSSILGACQKWQNSELGQRVFELAARSISEDDGGFYFMYNIYADHTEYSTNHV